MSDLKQQIGEQLHQAQAKYVYFLLAVAASGIGFAVQRTTAQPLEWHHAILGVAVVLWGASFFAGCRNRAYFSSTLYANVTLLSLQDCSHPETPNHPEAVAAACEGVREAAEENSATSNLWGQWQFRLLVARAAVFLLWHVVCMAMMNSGNENESNLTNREQYPMTTKAFQSEQFLVQRN